MEVTSRLIDEIGAQVQRDVDGQIHVHSRIALAEGFQEQRQPGLSDGFGGADPKQALGLRQQSPVGQHVFVRNGDRRAAAFPHGVQDQEVAQRLGAAREILREHGNYSWLTEKGSFVILNNGIEFACTYLLMLVSLLFTGGGRYTSVDYYLSRLVNR